MTRVRSLRGPHPRCVSKRRYLPLGSGSSSTRPQSHERCVHVHASELRSPRLLPSPRGYFRSAFYAGLYNDVGPRAMGYPGGSLGYIDHPDFSLRKPVGRELTSDGNPP